MPRNLLPLYGMLASLLLTLSAAAQETGVHWQRDIETAKVMARDSGRLVLVHVVADGCGPCQSLETNVFAQPGVGGAIEQRFVPVKLNANEFPAIAQGFGITRVPTDLILTPDGQILSKAISPATPAAYVADTASVANQYAAQSGQPYKVATATPPNPPTLNQAYAQLAVGAPPMATPSVPMSTGTPPAAGTNAFAAPGAAAPAGTVMNNYAAQQPVTPVPTNPAADPYGSYAPPAAGAAPGQAVQNRYAAPTTPTTPAVPAPEVPTYNAPPVYNTPADTSVPPSNPAGPVSEEAQRPVGTQQAAAVPDQTKLPPGAPPLGFDGYCPVTHADELEMDRWRSDVRRDPSGPHVLVCGARRAEAIPCQPGLLWAGTGRH